ncbi:MAG: hypothetical protein SOW59_05980 [Corynebacterium sp.]|nr:hypothetical protein [Corynebacterium sp.]
MTSPYGSQSEPMLRWAIIRVTVLLLAGPLVATLSGCSAESSEEEKLTSTTSVTTTVTSTGATTTMTSTTEPIPSSESTDSQDSDDDRRREVIDTPDVPPTGQSATDERPVGFMGAPGQSDPVPLDKAVQSCGDISIHETGTTFFSDGTSGWTEQCSNQMMAARQAQPPAPAPAEQVPAAPAAPARGATCASIGHKTYAGDGVYALNQDKDGDGVGCESYPG